jgi:hypothetical protein
MVALPAAVGTAGTEAIRGTGPDLRFTDTESRPSSEWICASAAIVAADPRVVVGVSRSTVPCHALGAG